MILPLNTSSGWLMIAWLQCHQHEQLTMFQLWLCNIPLIVFCRTYYAPVGFIQCLTYNLKTFSQDIQGFLQLFYVDGECGC